MSMDITPPHLRCGMGSCPSVHYLKDGDYTPEHLRCGGSNSSCQSVVAHNGKLVIIGRKADDIAKELGLGVGPDEAVIEIGEEYFSALPELVHLRSEVASLREALGCQADVTDKGPVPSPSALQKSAGEDANKSKVDFSFEHEAVDGLRETGHSRLRMGKTEQMFFRVTPQKREQLKRLADFLSVGQPQTVSYTQTIEQALDALEEKLKLKK